MSESNRFYGKYRGMVTDNKDPLKKGRVRVKAPDVLSEKESGWAMPCVPYAGKGVGLFLIPPVDAFVWVEFEQGDLDYPIWCGCFWGEDESPESSPDVKILKTDVGTITINDKKNSGGITIETSDGLKIVMDSNGIEINNGQNASVKLSGSSVKLNEQALEIT